MSIKYVIETKFVLSFAATFGSPALILLTSSDILKYNIINYILIFIYFQEMVHIELDPNTNIYF